MTLGIMTLGTTVLITMILGIMAGLGVTAIIPVLGTGDLHGVIIIATGVGMAEAGIVAGIGDMPQYITDTTEADMLLPTLLAEVDGLPQTMLADVHITDLLHMVRQAVLAEVETSIAEQAD